MLRTVKILLLNPDLQIVYLVIGIGIRIRSQVPWQTALKLLEEEKNRSNPLPAGRSTPNRRTGRVTGSSRLTFEAQRQKEGGDDR